MDVVLQNTKMTYMLKAMIGLHIIESTATKLLVAYLEMQKEIAVSSLAGG